MPRVASQGMAVRFTACLLLALGCSAPSPEPTEPERSPVGTCGPDGYSVADAAPGDTYLASDPAIQSVVVSNGTVSTTLDGEAWIFGVVSRTSTLVPLVIQLRDRDHATLCSELN